MTTHKLWVLGLLTMFFSACNCGGRIIGAECSMTYTTGIRQPCEDGLVCVKSNERPCPDGEFDACFGICLLPCNPDGSCEAPCTCRNGTYCAVETSAGLEVCG